MAVGRSLIASGVSTVESWLVALRGRRSFHLAVLLLLAIPPHAVLFGAARHHEMWDTASYMMPARSLASGSGYVAPARVSHSMPDLNRSDAPLVPETIRTPGYPAFLALFIRGGVQLERAVAVQHALHVILVLGAYLFLATVTGERGFAFLAAALYAVWPPTIRLADQLVSEPLFSLVFLPSIALLLRAAITPRGAVAAASAAALLAGGAVLVRPAALYYAVAGAIFLAIFARRRRLALAVVFLLLSQLIPGAWAVRNHRATGVLTVSSLTGESALFFKAAGALAVQGRGTWYALTAVPFQDDFYRSVLKERHRLLAEATESFSRQELDAMHHAELARRYSALAAGVVRENIPELAMMAAGSVIHMLSGVFWQPAVEMSFHPRWRPELSILAALFFAFAAAGIGPLWRRHRELAALSIVTIVYFLAVSAGSEADFRLFEPVSVPYLVLASAGLLRAGGVWRRRAPSSSRT
jgi:hypothetical protein